MFHSRSSEHIHTHTHEQIENGEKLCGGDVGDDDDKNEKSLNFQVFTIRVKIIAVTLVICNFGVQREFTIIDLFQRTTVLVSLEH